MYTGAKLFIDDVIHRSGLEYRREFRFHPKRRFMSDWCIPSLNLLVEYEGLWFPNSRKGSGKSRHTSVTGYTTDTEKYNLATLEGYRVLRYTVMSYKQFEQDLKKILDANVNR